MGRAPVVQQGSSKPRSPWGGPQQPLREYRRPFSPVTGADINTNWGSMSPPSILHELLYFPQQTTKHAILIDRRPIDNDPESSIKSLALYRPEFCQSFTAVKDESWRKWAAAEEASKHGG